MSKAEDLHPTVSTTTESPAAPKRKAVRRKPAGRQTREGDTAPELSADGIERFEIEQAISAAEDSKLVAVTDILKTELGRDPQRAARALDSILAGASPDEDLKVALLFKQAQLHELELRDDVLVYTTAPLREAIERYGSATLHLDLVPGRDLARVTADVAHPRGSRSMASHLQSRLNLRGAKAALEVASARSPMKWQRCVTSMPGVSMRNSRNEMPCCGRPSVLVRTRQKMWSANCACVVQILVPFTT